jgi:hypothetical protein
VSNSTLDAKKKLLRAQWEELAILQIHNPLRNIEQECAPLLAEPPNEGLTIDQAKSLINRAAKEINHNGSK